MRSLHPHVVSPEPGKTVSVTGGPAWSTTGQTALHPGCPHHVLRIAAGPEDYLLGGYCVSRGATAPKSSQIHSQNALITLLCGVFIVIYQHDVAIPVSRSAVPARLGVRSHSGTNAAPEENASQDLGFLIYAFAASSSSCSRKNVTVFQCR